MELRYVANTVSRGLISFNSVHHIIFSRCLSSSPSPAPQEGKIQASNHSSSSTNAETLSARDKQSPTLTPTKTVAQADAELRERLERMSGDGGAAGIEYEDGKPSAMKRGVRNNMFRLI